MSVVVVKLIVVTDADTAARIEEIADLPVKSREDVTDRFILERSGVPVELHFVAGEVI